MKTFKSNQTSLLIACLFGFLLLFGCSMEDHQIQGTFRGAGEAELWGVDYTTCEPNTFRYTIPGEIIVTGRQIGTQVIGALYIPDVFQDLPLPISGTSEVIGAAAHLNFTLGLELGTGSYHECSGTIIATDLTEDRIADSLQLDPNTRSACVHYWQGQCNQMYIIKSGELLSSSYE